MELRRENSLLADAMDSMKVQLFICLRNLNLNVGYTKIVVKLNQPGKPLRTVLETKPKVFDKNVDYDQTLILDYVFQVRQILTFEVQDYNRNVLGTSTMTVGQIFGQREKRIIKSIQANNKEEIGRIIVRCQAVASNSKFVQMSIQALHLPDFTILYFFGGTCPFFRIIKKRKAQNYLVYESEVITNSRNPRWKKLNISERKLCDNDESMMLIFQILNFKDNGRHEVIGQFQFTLQSLSKLNTFDVLKNQRPVDRARVIFEKVERTRRYAFTDFIMGGMEIQLITCIDFTGSNGIATRPQSLHYIGGSKRTAYQAALKAVGDILLDYDTDKLIPTYGFGAKVKLPNFNTQGKVHQAFPLNGNPEEPQVYHVQSMLQVYRECIPFLQFAGPTVLAPLLRQNMNKCRQLKMNGNQYMILLILTDGDIVDQLQVCDLLIQCSRLPLSIVIVGIGNGSFDIMERIDDDAMVMTSKDGKRTERDLVQFVPFRNFSNNGVELAKEVLAQLPKQVVEYHALCKLQPRQVCDVGHKLRDNIKNYVVE